METETGTESGRSVKVGLAVFDRDGERIGYVDNVAGKSCWMQVGLGDLELQQLWIPFRMVKSVDQREVILTVTKEEARSEYATPPPRQVTVEQRAGATLAITTEPSGYDGAPVTVGEVDVNSVKQQLAVDQRVWTADLAEVGKIKDFDATTTYLMVEKGILSRRHDVFIPVHIVASVARGAAEVTLSVRKADLERMQRLEPVDVIIDVPAVPGY